MVKDFVSKDTCDARFSDVKADVNEIKENIKLIKENHLVHIEKNMTDILLKFVSMDTSNSIKNKVIWGFMGAAISLIVAYVFKTLGVQ